MPEGDTIYRVAVTLRKALLGREICAFESRLDAVREADRIRSTAGRIVHAVEPRGKHLLVLLREQGAVGAPIRTPDRLELELLPTDTVLHTHLRMTGSWHLYRPGEPWRKPERYAKVVLRTTEFVAICFSAPVVELLTAREAARHPDLATLGPDAMTDDFDPLEARRRLRARPDLELGVAIMSQHAMAGIGNEFKSEVLFIRRLNPWLRVRELDDETLDALIAECAKLLRANRTIGERRTNFSLDERHRVWVYGRENRPCRVCSTTIRQTRQGLDGRVTFYCTHCQSVDNLRFS